MLYGISAMQCVCVLSVVAHCSEVGCAHVDEKEGSKGLWN